MPGFKKDSKLGCFKYRPMSYEKILEKLMYKKVYNFLTENNIVYDLQYGFRQKCFITYVLINLTKNIRQALDGGYVECGIFVDFIKLLTHWIMKYFYLNLITMVFKVY